MTITKYSDSLLQFAVKAFNPAKYRDQTKVEVSGSLDLIERLTAGRAAALVELARLRGATVPSLMRDLGLGVAGRG